MTRAEEAFPAPPWRLRGEGFIQLQFVDARHARAWVPPGLSIVSVLPGKTLAGIYCACYNTDSTLQYHELIIVAALVRHRFSVGGWISHIYVDDLHSEAGGREIWSLPKEQAQFNELPGNGMKVSQGATTLCTISGGKPKTRAALPLFAPVITQEKDRPKWFRGSGKAVCGLGRGKIDVPDVSPFASMGLGRGRRVQLDKLDLVMHAPK